MPIGSWQVINVDQLYVAAAPDYSGETCADVRSFYSTANHIPQEKAVNIMRIPPGPMDWPNPIQYIVLLFGALKVRGRLGVPLDKPVYLQRVAFIDERNRWRERLPVKYWT